MNFQFYCPNSHLLQADVSQAGSVIACPICNVQFVIPAAPQQAVVTPVITSVNTPAPKGDLDFSTPPSQKASKGPNLNELLGGNSAPEKQFAPSPKEEEPQEANPFSMLNEKKEKAQKLNDALSVKNALQKATKEPKKAVELDVVHIPCPKGHVLDVDKEMLGQRVMCPVCHSVYDLKLESSLEFIREKKAAEDIEEARLGRIWIMRAGMAGIVLILFLIFLLCT